MTSFLRRLFRFPTDDSGLASLDMRGRLVIDVQEAIRRGRWADEINAAKRLGEMLRAKRKERS